MRASSRPRRGLDYFSAATVAYVVQLALLYWCTALLKNGPEWTRDGTALYYALSLDQLLLPGGRLLYPHPDLLRFLTFATYYMELLLPFALFIPVGVTWWRLLVVGVLFGFHLGISLTLFVGLFFLINMASLLGLLPPLALDWLSGAAGAARGAGRAAGARRLPAWQLPWRLRLERTRAPAAGQPPAGARRARNLRGPAAGLRVLVEPRRRGRTAPRRRPAARARALVWLPVSRRPALGHVCARRVQRRWLVHPGRHHRRRPRTST